MLNRNILKLSSSYITKTRLYSSFEDLKQKFNKFNGIDYSEILQNINPNISKLSKASILVPICKNDQKLCFMLTKRSEKMQFYGGQVCFIGGKMDKNDQDEIKTAYREAYEEVGIKQSDFKFLAKMFPIVVTNYLKDAFLLTPIVVYVDEYKNLELNINHHEVDEIHYIPTDTFLSKTNHEINEIGKDDEEFYLHYFNLNQDNDEICIWGVTSVTSILVSSIIHDKKPEFVFDPGCELDPSDFNNFMNQYVTKITRFIHL